MKPATALPWKDGPVFNRGGRALFWTDTSKPGKWQRRIDGHADGVLGQLDAAYIVHACNAYPKLAQALRNTLRLHDSTDTRALVICSDARAILRALGESS